MFLIWHNKLACLRSWSDSCFTFFSIISKYAMVVSWTFQQRELMSRICRTCGATIQAKNDLILHYPRLPNILVLNKEMFENAKSHLAHPIQSSKLEQLMPPNDRGDLPVKLNIYWYCTGRVCKIRCDVRQLYVSRFAWRYFWHLIFESGLRWTEMSCPGSNWHVGTSYACTSI